MLYMDLDISNQSSSICNRPAVLQYVLLYCNCMTLFTGINVILQLNKFTNSIYTIPLSGNISHHALHPVDFTFKVARVLMSHPLGSRELSSLLWRMRT